MKILHLATVVGGAVSAISAAALPDGDDVVNADAWTTSTVYTTAVYTVTQCGPGVTNCPEDGTAIVTSIIAVTTTVCPVTSTPIPSVPITAPASTKSSSSVIAPTSISSSVVPSSAAPSSSGSKSAGPSISLTIPIVPPPTPSTRAKPSSSSASGASSSGSATAPGSYSTSASGSSESSIGASSSSVASSSLSSLSLHTTFTDSVPTSFKPSSSNTVTSSGYVPPPADSSSSKPTTFSNSVPTTFNPSASVGPSSGVNTPPSAGSSLTGSTDTAAIPTSYTLSISSTLPSSLLVSSSSNAGGSGYPSTVPPLLTSQISSGTEPAHTHTTVSNSTIGQDTTYVTSILTQTLTSAITAPLSKTTSSDIQDKPTSLGTSVSGNPSGSGYPIPSVNGTIMLPTPTYTPEPIYNLGYKVAGAGTGSMVAIIVAFIFAHFA